MDIPLHAEITRRPDHAFGPYQIVGTASRLGVPGGYRVAVLDRLTLSLIERGRSSDEGAYVFKWLPLDSYLVLAVDDTGEPVNAAISDYITPEPM